MVEKTKREVVILSFESMNQWEYENVKDALSKSALNDKYEIVLLNKKVSPINKKELLKYLGD